MVGRKPERRAKWAAVALFLTRSGAGYLYAKLTRERQYETSIQHTKVNQRGNSEKTNSKMVLLATSCAVFDDEQRSEMQEIVRNCCKVRKIESIDAENEEQCGDA